MSLHSRVPQALPCRPAQGVHGVQHFCWTMLWFLGCRRFPGSRLSTERFSCLSCVFLCPILFTLHMEFLSLGLSAHEYSAGSCVAPGTKRSCLAGCGRLLQIGTTRAALVNIPIAHPSCRHRELLRMEYGSSFLPPTYTWSPSALQII